MNDEINSIIEEIKKYKNLAEKGAMDDTDMFRIQLNMSILSVTVALSKIAFFFENLNTTMLDISNTLSNIQNQLRGG
jgi:hypothetical protein